MAQTPYSTQAPVAYQHILNAGTVLVKSAAGALLSLNVNSVGAASTVTMYDVNNTSTLGTIEVGILSLGTSYAAPAQIPIGPSGAGLKFTSGLVMVTTGTCDLTFGFR